MTWKRIFVVVGVIFVLFAVWVTDNYVYPIKADNPNFSDVETAFAKLQFPSEWTEVSSSENRGLHGRACDPFNDSGCFHKSRTFKVPETTTAEEVKSVLIAAGCPGVVASDITLKGDEKSSTTMECSIGAGVSYGADLMGLENEVYISAKTY